MDVQHTTGAAMKMVYRKDNKLPMYCAATKLPIWDSVKDVYPVTIKQTGNWGYPGTYWSFATFIKVGVSSETFYEEGYLYGSGNDVAHGGYNVNSHYTGTGLFGNRVFEGADKFEKPIITFRFSTFYVGLNRKVGFNFTNDIQVRHALLWYQRFNFPDDDDFVPPPIWSVTPEVTVKVSCAVADTIEQTFSVPTHELYNFYGGGKPSGYICDIHWDNDTDTLSFV